MLRTSFTALASLALISTAAPPAPPPPLLAQAVAATIAQKHAYAFDYQSQSDGTVNGEAKPAQQMSWRAHFDPGGAAPHLHLVDPPHLQGGSQQAFNTVAQHMDGVNWCASSDMASAQGVHLMREDVYVAVYSFQPNSAQIRGGGMATQMAQRLHGEMTVSKAAPDVTDIHMALTQAYSPIPFTNITTLDVALHCETAPNGRRYASATVTQLAGTAFGRAFTEHSVTHTTNLTAAP